MIDQISIADRLELLYQRTRRMFGSGEEVLGVRGYFESEMYERGKLVPGSRREGKNIWTLTGREYITGVISYKLYDTNAHNTGNAQMDLPYRDDRIRYIGFGTGTQPEVSTVTRLVTPVAYEAGNKFLAELAAPSSPTGGKVAYTRLFSETELSIVGSIVLSEAGLFTDGDPANGNAPKTRNLTLGSAALQAPVAYRALDPFKKTQNFAMRAKWTISL